MCAAGVKLHKRQAKAKLNLLYRRLGNNSTLIAQQEETAADVILNLKEQIHT